MNDAFIDGQWVNNSQKSFSINNPATDELVGQIPQLEIFDIYRAIEAAKRAFEKWKVTPVQIRSQMLHSLCDRMLENQDELAEIITLENGKPLGESKGEIAYTASFIRWYAEEAKRVYGETIPANSSKNRILVQKEPIGVCAMITPWNTKDLIPI